MVIRENYVIKQNTVALKPEFDFSGNLLTRVIEGFSTFLVKMSPLQVMEHSAAYYGHCLKGATNAAKLILGRIDMAPVKISGSLGLYWFPTMSPTNKNCAWLSLSHYKNAKPKSRKETKVFMKFGHKITIKGNVKRFKLKVHRARELESTMEDRHSEKTYFSIEPQGLLYLKEHISNIYDFIQSSQNNNTREWPSQD